MLRSPPSLGFVVLVIALVLGGCARPEDRFMREVEQRLAKVNEGDYGSVVEWIEPGFRRELEGAIGDLRPYLLMQRRADQESGRQYRAAELRVFAARDYAEVVFERSGPGAIFDGREMLLVPFVFADGRWWIAGEARGGGSPDYRLRP